MTYSTDPRVDAYLEGLPEWQQAVCREVRDLVHAADPEVTETIKRTRQPYFVLHGNVCALLAAKDHVNVFLYDGAIVPDPDGIITSGHDNQTARTVAVRRGETINAPALRAMFQQIIANNRAGGWRTLKRELFHITERAAWEAAARSGEYRLATRDVPLEQQGFIHCSLRHQLRAVAERHYGDADDLVVLVIDGAKVPAPVRYEGAAGPESERYPHIYGPVPTGAVTQVIPVTRDPAGRLLLPE